MHRRRQVRVLGVLGIVSLTGCATSSSPLVLRVAALDRDFEPGSVQRIEAALWNRGPSDLRFETGSALRHMLLCRLPADPPDEWGIGTGSGVEGGVWGGVTHRKPDPSDPYFCREFPPESFVLRAGDRLPLAADVVTPGACIGGAAELEISFYAPDHGRKCPGIQYGEVGSTTRRVRIARAGDESAPPPSASPGELACEVRSAGEPEKPVLILALRNDRRRPWRARAVPSVELEPVAEGADAHWAPIELSDPPAPLAAGATWPVEIPAGGELLRRVPLTGLAWGNPYGEWPAPPYGVPAPGRYRARFWLEVVGGKSWQLRCPEVTIELPAP